MEDKDKLSKDLYKIVASHLDQFIDEFEVDVRKPLFWSELTPKKKAYWRKESKKLCYHKPVRLLNPEEAYRIYCNHPEYTHNTIRAGSVAKAQLDLMKGE